MRQTGRDGNKMKEATVFCAALTAALGDADCADEQVKPR